jgi:uncharacterized protein YjeT (DUF2065 family)
VWFKWGARFLTLLGLLIVLAGLVVLALPGTMEGRELVQLDAMHSLHVTDFVGLGMVISGVLLIWVSVLTWQHKHIR